MKYQQVLTSNKFKVTDTEEVLEVLKLLELNVKTYKTGEISFYSKEITFDASAKLVIDTVSNKLVGVRSDFYWCSIPTVKLSSNYKECPPEETLTEQSLCNYIQSKLVKEPDNYVYIKDTFIVESFFTETFDIHNGALIITSTNIEELNFDDLVKNFVEAKTKYLH